MVCLHVRGELTRELSGRQRAVLGTRGRGRRSELIKKSALLTVPFSTAQTVSNDGRCMRRGLDYLQKERSSLKFNQQSDRRGDGRSKTLLYVILRHRL